MPIVCSLTLTGCGRSSSDADGTETADLPVPTALSGAATVPAPLDVTPTSLRPPRGLATPEAASQNLWDAWRDNDRERALLFAAKTAVDQLFSLRWRPDAHNEGCGTGATSLQCVYLFTERRGVVARIISIDGDPQRGYRAASVRSIDELPKSDRLNGAVIDEARAPAETTLVDAFTPTDTTTLDAAGQVSAGASVPVDDSTSDATATASLDATAPTVIASSVPSSRAPRTTRRPRTSRARPRTTTAPSPVPVTEAPQSSPAPAPSPAPSPAPAPAAPVQAGGGTVESVGNG